MYKGTAVGINLNDKYTIVYRSKGNNEKYML